METTIAYYTSLIRVWICTYIFYLVVFAAAERHLDHPNKLMSHQDGGLETPRIRAWSSSFLQANYPVSPNGEVLAPYQMDPQQPPSGAFPQAQSETIGALHRNYIREQQRISSGQQSPVYSQDSVNLQDGANQKFAVGSGALSGALMGAMGSGSAGQGKHHL